MSQSGLMALRRAEFEHTGYTGMNGYPWSQTALKQFYSSAKPKNNDERHVLT
jgi:hypothetical protein